MYAMFTPAGITAIKEENVIQLHYFLQQVGTKLSTNMLNFVFRKIISKCAISYVHIQQKKIYIGKNQKSGKICEKHHRGV